MKMLINSMYTIIITHLASCIIASQIDQFDFSRSALVAHNKLRMLHRVAPLVMNKELSEIAQAYAEKLAYYSLSLEPSYNSYANSQLGENLASFYGYRQLKGEDAVNMWYEGYSSYDFQNPQFSMEAGSFSQVVWKSSQQVGFGVAQSPHNMQYYVVANYLPAGNVQGQFAKNVFERQQKHKIPVSTSNPEEITTVRPLYVDTDY